MPEVDALADSVFKAVEDYLARSLVTFEKRLDEIVAARVAALPVPKDGEPGKEGPPGKDADQESIAILHSALAALQADSTPSKYICELTERLDSIDKRFAELPIPKDGAPGLNGEPGKDFDPIVLAEIQSDIADLKSSDVASSAVDLARKAIAAAAKATEHVEALAAIPKSPNSFVIDDAGELVAVYPDGTTKSIGMVRGKDGIRGASLMDGHVDESGQLVLRMSDSRIINAGAVRGKDGVNAEGKQGLPGRDAPEVRILAAIDETKSYPEGTYASYRGGEIRAERTTDPIVDGDVLAAGWRVAREGIAEQSKQVLDEGRVIEETTTYTSGRTFIFRNQSNALIYRGIWKDGEFTRGDTVTWDGSLWHCERETKERPGGLTGNGDWKLCVKHGSPGKDGKTVKGDPGPPGRPGHDLTQLGPNGAKY